MRLCVINRSVGVGDILAVDRLTSANEPATASACPIDRVDYTALATVSTDLPFAPLILHWQVAPLCD